MINYPKATPVWELCSFFFVCQADHQVFFYGTNEMFQKITRISYSLPFLDFGDSKIGHICIGKGRFGNYIRLSNEEGTSYFRLPDKYCDSQDLCKSLKIEQVVSLIDQKNLKRKEKLAERKKSQLERRLNIIKDLGETKEGHFYNN